MEKINRSPEETADTILELYQKYGGSDYIGEPVSQLEHMCQCAMLAEEEGYDDEVILAALFHDIGHFCEHFMEVEQMANYGVVDHERLGADFLRNLNFSEKIASLVQNHVEAKRYLTHHFPSYYENLSEASKQTLTFQGGVMSENEASNFESDQLFDMHIRLRRWDEKAKQENIVLNPMNRYREMIITHLNR
ncbi:MAG TPA: HD domain-containing protein [Flavitalea sp.]|nr:HD domain-containing protein [Flavitalea sp.]